MLRGTVPRSAATFEKPERILDTIPRHYLHELSATIRLHDPQPGTQLPVRMERNVLGQIVREIDGLGRAEEWQRDATGNVISGRDRDGRITERHIGSWNLVLERSDPLGHGVRYRYSPTERITAIQDPLGNTSRYDYDLKGRLIRVRRNNRIREEYVYDVGDHFIEKCAGDGKILFTNQIHDNHLVALRQLASGGIHRYDYDTAGRVTVASTAEHDIRLAYDDRGRRISDLRDGAGVQHVFTDRSCDTRIFDRFATVTRRQRKNAVRLVDATGAATVLRHYESGNRTAAMQQRDGRNPAI